MEQRKRKIAVLTSGGDAPGLNACINAVVRTAIYYNYSVLGIRDGYEGLITGRVMKLDLTDVNDIIHLGGTILKTSRSEQFKIKEGRLLAYEQVKQNDIDHLIVIGGDGSLKGASIFSKEYNDISIIGIPKTIDNDISGTDYSIGYDTALNTAVSAVDKLRDTAESHNRIFIVEVMGRDAGYIAYGTGLATGAEGILIPETHMDHVYLLDNLRRNWHEKRSSLILIVAEGDETGGARRVAEEITNYLGNKEIRISILGHIQRGGSPTAFDRILATQLGNMAVTFLNKGAKNVMVGFQRQEIITIPLKDVGRRSMSLNEKALKLLEIMTS
ncbi:6-phosphofructokinase [Zhouia amylolytica]|uniref:6-phosphofructokinase n=1 Tax=Zhouia amylolytica TaxID=376730 RepID=UPI0020CB7867|nr:6-phosphofructokinase [Zhouia amylolytica]MCQ0110048.1 6-phosphofructokinase [Zhouia amylolytica]